MASELQSLLLAARNAQPFGPEGYGTMTPDRQALVFGQMEDVKAGFEEDMAGRLERGFPDFDLDLRNKILGDISLLSVAYSAGLSNGELPTPKLVSMAALTAITGVANRLIDRGDPLMRNATLDWCETSPLEGVISKAQDPRRKFMQGLDEITSTVVSPGDYEPTALVLRKLMAANVAAHDLTVEWREAGKEHEAEFLAKNADRVAYALLTTGAIQSATIPLNAMYHAQALEESEDSKEPSASEVLSDPSVQEQGDAANGLIRTDDDFGDRLRDASSEKMSINLFNLAPSAGSELVIMRFCVQAGIKDLQRIGSLVTSFHAVADNGGEEAMEAIRGEFEENFRKVNDKVPERLVRQETLILRALAAGRANAAGDDALAA